MRLKELLTDSAAINILKFLFDMESGDNKVYSTNISHIKKQFSNFKKIEGSINILSEMDLINLDNLKEDNIASISAKGKHFIDAFDKLVQITERKEPKKQKSYKIRYDLTPKEKKVMVVIFKLSKELGNKAVPMQDLAREIYPVEDASKKASVSRCVSKLVNINLVEKEKMQNKAFVKLTPTGERTIREQLIEVLL
jgi:DNA-binding MarR family transcriptional regulator